MKPKQWLSVLAFIFCATTAYAQDEGPKAGIGLSLNPPTLGALDLDGGVTINTGLPFDFGNFYFPIVVSPKFKIEPEFGLFRASIKYQDGGFTDEEKATILRLGLGLFYVFPTKGDLRGYVGPRLGFIYTTASDNGSDVSETDWVLGLALGGEYFFSSHFALGGEAQLNYIRLGKPDSDDGGDYDLSRHVISTHGLILVRWYF
jgi:hypothetical protein